LCVSASQNHRVADVVPAIFMKLMNIHEPLMNFWRFCAPRGAVCVNDLGFSRGEFPFKRRIHFTNSFLVFDYFPRVFEFFSASSRLLRGDRTREISSSECFVEEIPIVLVVPFIEGFGRGQLARAYSRPFT
jgi:hypothetical protein